ncbi:hypothetical protein AVEN_236064-1 [Araneus ventricosus]|uniref:Uncharacterized protein n=1 Tax=Araneus ventricosus TaxID=182803 RepID=A0A4Y2VEG1_ARAVE|nr:hypothetical protein AVEN_48319-1 [Araneus ventricosus]GBO23696.1 hypothetical protein AVEN_236064-1 [Araneus ventricosus]
MSPVRKGLGKTLQKIRKCLRKWNLNEANSHETRVTWSMSPLRPFNIYTLPYAVLRHHIFFHLQDEQYLLNSHLVDTEFTLGLHRIHTCSTDMHHDDNKRIEE